MNFEVRSERRGPDGGYEVVVLEGSGVVAEVCPALGFNCYRWSAGGAEILYADPQFFEGGSPTRSGIPILFPFPNRIRGGRFTWDGIGYQLPLNDPARKNAIHGFTPRKPWCVIDRGADDASAWATGEFHGSRDAPESSALWPADYQIRVTHRLTANVLRTEAVALNPGRSPLPYGLGYHHYFRAGQGAWVTAPAGARWELVENLPTGRKQPPEPSWDLNAPRRFEDLTLDDVLTELPREGGPDGLCPRGSIRLPAGTEIRLGASPAFRELVLFTPPHRRAVCLEPYTCATDAINLQRRGVDAGWMVLGPGQNWSAVVEVTAKAA